MPTKTQSPDTVYLQKLPLGKQVHLRDTNGDSWYLRRVERGRTRGNLISGFLISSTNPNWIRTQGSQPRLLAEIPTLVRANQLYHIGGFEITIASINQ